MTTPLRNRRTFTILVAALALTSLAALAAVPVAVRRAQDNQVATAPLPSVNAAVAGLLRLSGPVTLTETDVWPVGVRVKLAGTFDPLTCTVHLRGTRRTSPYPPPPGTTPRPDNPDVVASSIRGAAPTGDAGLLITSIVLADSADACHVLEAIARTATPSGAAVRLPGGAVRQQLVIDQARWAAWQDARLVRDAAARQWRMTRRDLRESRVDPPADLLKSVVITVTDTAGGQLSSIVLTLRDPQDGPEKKSTDTLTFTAAR